ncbi:unnamed protein product [Didymodactylos carnosus]|uniref:Uncharacterized protein n=1 Tax=Didymodactylos carnosus TaxID=1234261 RepID=A0A8S2DV81_9BILA|nr:unnamed protein product [Didymodactylos carnosus]CAF3828393.1 unnamed protein product [Didymodactylos carnosus]
MVHSLIDFICNLENTTRRLLSYLNDNNDRHMENLLSEKRKVTVIGEENESDELENPLLENDVGDFGVEDEYTGSNEDTLKELFTAVESGSIDRLEELFDASQTDMNITRFAESLLMAAIRSRRENVAEYLIDQGIDVNYATDLIEFRPKTRYPVRYRYLSCRQLAYDLGMMDLVDLIDLSSDEVRPSIKKYLQRRLKKRLEKIHKSYQERIKTRELKFQEEQKSLQPIDITLIEEEEEQKKPMLNMQQIINEHALDNADYVVPTTLPPPLPPPQLQLRRPERRYVSHINETLNSLHKPEKNIEESHKKTFDYSQYRLKFKIIDMDKVVKRTRFKQQLNENSIFAFNPQVRPKTTTAAVLPAPKPRDLYVTSAKSRQTIKTIDSFDIQQQSSYKETKTSICRSARQRPQTENISNVTQQEPPKQRGILPFRHYLNSLTKSGLSNSNIQVTNTSVVDLNEPKLSFTANNAYIAQIPVPAYERKRVPVTLQTGFGLPSFNSNSRGSNRFIRT